MTSDAENSASPASPDSPTSRTEPVDTEQLERSRRAIDEGHAAAAHALNSPPDEQDLDFTNVKANDEPDSSDNAVPRPN